MCLNDHEFILLNLKSNSLASLGRSADIPKAQIHRHWCSVQVDLLTDSQIHSKQVGLWGNVRLPRKQVCSVIPTDIDFICIYIHNCIILFQQRLNYINVYMYIWIQCPEYSTLLQHALSGCWLPCIWNRSDHLNFATLREMSCCHLKFHCPTIETVRWSLCMKRLLDLYKTLQSMGCLSWSMEITCHTYQPRCFSESTGNSISCLSKNCGLGVKDCFFPCWRHVFLHYQVLSSKYLAIEYRWKEIA